MTKTAKLNSPINSSIQAALDNWDDKGAAMSHLNEAQYLLDGTLASTPARTETLGFTIPQGSIDWGTY